MEQLFTIDALISLLTLTTLEVVLGIDNVIFVSILMGRMSKEEQLKARRIWMFAGITVRILLLLAIGWLVKNGNAELFGFDFRGAHLSFNLRNVIMFVGGLFLLYKTVKEIHHKLEGDEESLNPKNNKQASFGALISQIIVIDMVFSFDSIITAVGLAKIVGVMIVAVIIAMIIMFFFADKISGFIHQHPTLKMLALAFLLMVGFSLFFEGLEPIHHSHIDKGYIYFAMAFSFGVEMLNMWMRKREKKKKPVELREPSLKENSPAANNSSRQH
ncbi:TerC family protein [Pseudoflavitalea sp. G-6-1-2]|uniref:TerC family protein n=1 Tax=Pseudoflavitalea sp. G-6-1-2 TaxID=2728841 RepID=UPI00146BE494|nr:TerC family protein [Pseudoflavitalea sp. G-6-1-2]NML20592.1 TerC family protein [Pseudoflavitalea sp. G-6-1-2]